ncbi:MAG: hypothetical protein ACKVQB_09155 [Bacteroidia bacterium]
MNVIKNPSKRKLILKSILLFLMASAFVQCGDDPTSPSLSLKDISGCYIGFTAKEKKDPTGGPGTITDTAADTVCLSEDRGRLKISSRNIGTFMADLSKASATEIELSVPEQANGMKHANGDPVTISVGGVTMKIVKEGGKFKMIPVGFPTNTCLACLTRYRVVSLEK